MSRPINRLLIANRGEIAVRVISAAKSLGIETVAVFSDADSDALHVGHADHAVGIGPAAAHSSYLAVENIIDAATSSGADAIHPGYGFLSENADFARAVEKAGLIFVGPSADVIDQMGDKRTARHLAQDAGVPTVPGYDGDDMSDTALAAEAEKIGAPLMIKATAGGGGRGLRRVDDLAGFGESLDAARREAGSAFGNTDIMLEKLIEDARHVEVQVLADSHGKMLHLFERDCSAQRRHQKVIEEAPCSAISDAARQKLCAAAVKLADAIGYVGAGTVEFLVDNDEGFYFLEMNTRLQVEHPVSEMITGIDLVAEQLRIAAGAKLAFGQGDLSIAGHAIEARLYTEDPAADFLPQTGKLGRLGFPSGDGLRVDSGVVEGAVVSPFYDPMLAKLIAFGATREEARKKLLRMLADTHIAGVTTNKSYLSQILASDAFKNADHRTDTLTSLAPEVAVNTFERAALVGAVSLAKALDGFAIPALAGWRTLSDTVGRMILLVEDQAFELQLEARRSGSGWHVSVTCDDGSADVDVTILQDDRMQAVTGGRRTSVAHYADGKTVFLDTPAGHITATDITHAPPKTNSETAGGLLVAPMDGQVVAVNHATGDTVKAGDLIIVIEAMKIEHQVRAGIDGTLDGLSVTVGDQVKGRQQLAVIEPAEEAANA